MNLIEWRLKVLKSAERELDELPEAAYREVVNAIADLIEDPHPPGSIDRKSTRLNSSHIQKSRMPSSA